MFYLFQCLNTYSFKTTIGTQEWTGKISFPNGFNFNCYLLYSEGVHNRLLADINQCYMIKAFFVYLSISFPKLLLRVQFFRFPILFEFIFINGT